MVVYLKKKIGRPKSTNKKSYLKVMNLYFRDKDIHNGLKKAVVDKSKEGDTSGCSAYIIKLLAKDLKANGYLKN